MSKQQQKIFKSSKKTPDNRKAMMTPALIRTTLVTDKLSKSFDEIKVPGTKIKIRLEPFNHDNVDLIIPFRPGENITLSVIERENYSNVQYFHLNSNKKFEFKSSVSGKRFDLKVTGFQILNNGESFCPYHPEMIVTVVEKTRTRP
jgi:hypothetical protein